MLGIFGKRQVAVSFDTPLQLIVQQTPPPEPSKAGVRVYSTCDGFTVKGMAPIMYTLPNDKSVQVKIAYVDAKGNPAKVDGDVEWTSSDEDICGIATTGDSTLVTLIPGSKIGQCQIKATADADLGEGVREIVTPFDMEVVAGEAVAGTISPVGEPQPIPVGKSKR